VHHGSPWHYSFKGPVEVALETLPASQLKGPIECALGTLLQLKGEGS